MKPRHPLNLNCETAAFGPDERGFGSGTDGVGGLLNRFDHDAPELMGEFQVPDMRTEETLWKHRRRAPLQHRDPDHRRRSRLRRRVGVLFLRLRRRDWGRRRPLGGLSWTGILSNDLRRELRNSRQGSELFVFALP